MVNELRSLRAARRDAGAAALLQSDGACTGCFAEELRALALLV